VDPGGAAQRPPDDDKRKHESGQTGRPPSGAVLGRCARVVATGCCPARDRAIRYGRGRPLHPPTAPGRTWVMRMPGPQGPGQAPEHAPPQESRAGIQHARLPGQFAAASRAQVENQILPDRLHLMHAAAVTAQVSDDRHWAPARKNGPRAQAVRQKNSGPSPAVRDLSRLRLPGSGATPQHYATAAPEDRGSRHRPAPCAGDAARSNRSHALDCPGRLLDADQVPPLRQQRPRRQQLALWLILARSEMQLMAEQTSLEPLLTG
jgi:hypothetical protein